MDQIDRAVAASEATLGVGEREQIRRAPLPVPAARRPSPARQPDSVKAAGEHRAERRADVARRPGHGELLPDFVHAIGVARTRSGDQRAGAPLEFASVGLPLSSMPSMPCFVRLFARTHEPIQPNKRRRNLPKIPPDSLAGSTTEAVSASIVSPISKVSEGGRPAMKSSKASSTSPTSRSSRASYPW